MSQKANIPSAYLLYDGFCFLCSGSAKLLRRVDTSNKIKLLSLQSIQAHQLSKGPVKSPSDSVLLLHQGHQYQKSRAILRIFFILGGGWKIFLIFDLIPVSWRDIVYDWLAQNRYRWFGKKDKCDL